MQNDIVENNRTQYKKMVEFTHYNYSFENLNKLVQSIQYYQAII